MTEHNRLARLLQATTQFQMHAWRGEAQPTALGQRLQGLLREHWGAKGFELRSTQLPGGGVRWRPQSSALMERSQPPAHAKAGVSLLGEGLVHYRSPFDEHDCGWLSLAPTIDSHQGDLSILQMLLDSYFGAAYAGRERERSQQHVSELEASVALRTRELAYFSQHDRLTGLPNRNALLAALRRRLGAGETQHWLLFIDVNGLSRFSDDFTYESADDVLCELSTRLLTLFQMPARAENSPMITRLGGGEFVVLLSGEYWQKRSALERSAQQVISAMTRPAELNHPPVHCYVGIAGTPHHAQGGPELLSASEAARNVARRKGLNCSAFAEEVGSDGSRNEIQMESRLQRALDGQEFRLYYQPRLDLDRGRLNAAEALIRWRLPGHGLVSPHEFIYLAERSGMIGQIGQWVVQETCRQLAQWREQGLDGLRVSCNLSARQLQETRFIDDVASALHRFGIDGKYIELELTESELVADLSAAREMFAQLADLGVALAIDDFGTGHSSFLLLRQLPVAVLKIDKTFVRGMLHNSADRAIVDAIIRMGRDLDKRVVAEGVEEHEQIEVLREMGCHEIQGYRLSHPVPAEHFQRVVSDWQSSLFEAPEPMLLT